MKKKINNTENIPLNVAKDVTPKDKNKINKTVLSWILAIVTVLVVCGVTTGVYFAYQNNMNDKIEAELSKASIRDTITIELDNEAHKYTAQDFIKENNIDEENKFGEFIIQYDLSQPNTFEHKADAVKNEDVHLTAYFSKYPKNTKDYTVNVSVVDTTAPTFTEKVETIEITQGEDIDVASKFKADDKSGDVNITVDGTVDNNKVGNQTVNVFATDKNGNIANQEVTVVVKENVVETTTQKSPPTSQNNSSSSNGNSSSSKKTSGSSSSSTSSSNINKTNNNNSSSNSKPTTTEPTTKVAYWCTEGGSHHITSVGIGWYNSYNEAREAAYRYMREHGSGNYEVQQCDCGLYTVYVRVS